MIKILNSVYKLIFSVISLLLLFFWYSGYESAFEADRSCHVLLDSYSQQSRQLGCDHDTETHQWILFENQEDSADAKVIQRFRYRFL